MSKPESQPAEPQPATAPEPPERIKLTPFADGFICNAATPSMATCKETGTPISYHRDDLCAAGGGTAPPDEFIVDRDVLISLNGEPYVQLFEQQSFAAVNGKIRLTGPANRTEPLRVKTYEQGLRDERKRIMRGVEALALNPYRDGAAPNTYNAALYDVLAAIITQTDAQGETK